MFSATFWGSVAGASRDHGDTSSCTLCPLSHSGVLCSDNHQPAGLWLQNTGQVNAASHRFILLPEPLASSAMVLLSLLNESRGVHCSVTHLLTC